MKRLYLLAFSVFLVFFLAGFITLDHYGISWDEPTHFKRGQAYFHYFLTGKLTYEDLPKYDLEKAKSEEDYHERGLYQSDVQNGLWYLAHDGGHPPLNGILAAASNYIFYQKLGWLGDIESYHLFEVFISAVLVATVFLFAAEIFGLWVGLFAAIFMATYPLFWAESHFNIKDPAETAFIALAFYTFWKGIKDKRRLFIILSSTFAGFALATKFNILFMPLIVGPWLALLYLRDQKIGKFIKGKRTLIAFFFYPIIMFAILFATWPYLWQDFIGNTRSVFLYYKEIGTEVTFQPSFIVGQWNTYASSWILYTTQPIMLLFFFLGLWATKNLWRKKSVLVLWFLWFLVPILRVSVPETTIYGGVRQIMEYIPAMALIAGVGASYLMQNLPRIAGRAQLKVQNYREYRNRKRLAKFKIVKLSFLHFQLSFLFLIFAFSIFPIIRLHPNENVYFNFLTGGLRGAAEKDIPAAGFSFGNAYWQGIKWMNENAPPGSKLALIQGTNLNIPLFAPKPSLAYSNSYWTGILRGGEYLMELTYNSENRVYLYAWEYVEKMLNPVYEVRVDEVPILTIWKNDLEHTKPEYRKEEVSYTGELNSNVDDKLMEINLPQEVVLSRLIVRYRESSACSPVLVIHVDTSLDGQNWRREGDEIPLPVEQLSGVRTIENGKITYFLAAREARYIRLTSQTSNVCAFQNPQVELIILQ